MFNLSEVESRFATLRELSSKLTGFENSDAEEMLGSFRKTLDSFEKTLNRSKGVKQSNATITTLKRVLDSGITEAKLWVDSQGKGQAIPEDSLKKLKANLERTSQLLAVKKVSLQEKEVDQKYANDDIEQSRTLPEISPSHPDLSTSFSKRAFTVQTTIQNEADLTLLKGQLGALEVKLMQASRNLKETDELARRSSNRLKTLRGNISKLKPGTFEMADELSRLETILEEIEPVLENMPESPASATDIDEHASFYGTAFLEAMQSGGGVSGFYKKAKETSDSHEVATLKTENVQLKKEIKTLQADNKKLASEKVELTADLAQELTSGEILQQALDREIGKHAESVVRQARSDEEISRLTQNLEEENQRYLARDAEAKAALDAKEIAEQAAAFAVTNLDTVMMQVNESTRTARVAESDLAIRSAQLERNLEDLKHLNADILTLAELAENLQAEKDKYYTEAQYGYIRQKCDGLQRRRGELMERVRAAEKTAKQATLEIGYRDSEQRGHIQKLEAEIAQLKEKTFTLEQECRTLKSSNVVVQIEQLKATVKAQREHKFSDVLEQFDNAAAAGALVLEKKNQELQKENDSLKAQLAAQNESLPVIQTDESKFAKNIKRLAIGAGFILAGIATVAALGFLGAVAVTYALPFLAIGLVVAAGGTLMAKLLQSRHEDSNALEKLERAEGSPTVLQKTALVVKETLNLAASSISNPEHGVKNA